MSKGGEVLNFSEIGLENGSAFGVKRSILGDRVEEFGSGRVEQLGQGGSTIFLGAFLRFTWRIEHNVGLDRLGVRVGWHKLEWLGIWSVHGSLVEFVM